MNKTLEYRKQKLSKFKSYFGGPGSGPNPGGGSETTDEVHDEKNGKLYISPKAIIIHHATNTEPKISTDPNRLIPESISTSDKKDNVWGDKSFSGKINKGAKILEIDVKKEFWNYGNETDTPIERGKKIREYAKKMNADVVKLKNVPGVLGTEYSVINMDVIKWDKKSGE